MNINEDHIIDYLEGNLIPAHLQLFEEELKVNSNLREALLAQQLANEALAFNQDQDLKAKLRLWNDTAIEKSKVVNPHPKQFKLPSRWLAVAASLIVILGAIFLFTRPSEADELFAAYYTEPTTGLSREINNREVSEDYLNGVKHYAAKRYQQALQEFRKVNSDDPLFEETELLTLDCLIKSNDWTSAFEQVNKSLNYQKSTKVFSDRMEWTKILLLVRSKELASALELNEAIIENPDHLFRARALQLKAELDAK